MNLDNLKRQLRIQMQLRLRRASLEDREASSVTICERVLALPVWKSAHVVSVFEPTRGEPQIALLVDDLRRRGREIITILPTARAHEDISLIVPLDLVLVPGLAFTRDGGRLGRGGGFFDRFLFHRAQSAAKIGVGFAFQIVDTLPLEAHDVKLNAVITD